MIRAALVLWVLGALGISAWLSRAGADQLLTAGAAPVVTIRSNGGVITIDHGDAGAIRLSGPDSINVTRFVVSRVNNGRVILPRAQPPPVLGGRRRVISFTARQFLIPGLRDGADGITIDNPGGDMTVRLPPRVGALFINAGGGSVVATGFAGPYVIVADSGNVYLRNVAGHGLVRTFNGTVVLAGVGGDVHIETAQGRVTARMSRAARAEVKTQDGDIDWSFKRLGNGAYRFHSLTGNVHIRLPDGITANVDAQSDSGGVVNMLDPGAVDMRFSSPHALSMSVAGGGPEIMATSKSGIIIIAPADR